MMRNLYEINLVRIFKIPLYVFIALRIDDMKETSLALLETLNRPGLCKRMLCLLRQDLFTVQWPPPEI